VEIKSVTKRRRRRRKKKKKNYDTFLAVITVKWP